VCGGTLRDGELPGIASAACEDVLQHPRDFFGIFLGTEAMQNSWTKQMLSWAGGPSCRQLEAKSERESCRAGSVLVRCPRGLRLAIAQEACAIRTPSEELLQWNYR
jgi:hypothetical protein